MPRPLACSRFASSLLLLLLGIPACGKMGDPVPRTIVLPPTVQDLAVEVASGRNRLSFSLPQPVEWVEVYRHCEGQTPNERFNLIAQLNPDELGDAASPGRFSWLDPQRSAARCRYALKFVDSKGQRSEYSNFAP